MNPASLSHRLARLAALFTIGCGLFVLATWALDWGQLATFWGNYLPMAPITAVLFVGLGLALLTRTFWPEARVTRILGLIAGGLAGLISALELVRSIRPFPLPWDDWAFAVAANIGRMAVGQMAPLSAGNFLLAAIVLAILNSGLDRFAAARWAANLAAAAGCLIGWLIALAYATATPLGYGVNTVPMALLTAVAFIALHSAILLLGSLPPILRRWQGLDSWAPIPEKTLASHRRLLLASGGLIGLITLTGLVYLRIAQQAARVTVHEQLAAIASLKVEQIATWRSERRSEAIFLQRTPGVAQDLAAFLARPDDPATRIQLLGWLESIKGGNRYDSIAVFDPAGQLRLAVPADPGPAAPLDPESLAQVLASPEPIFIDLHRAANGAAIFLGLLVTIPSPAAGKQPPAPLAVIALRVNPENRLYPLIQHWPLPSVTGEFLLLRREGEEVVYLNELRHRPGQALVLRRSTTDVAPLGPGENLREARDYRGVPTLAVMQPVPDTPWTLMAKIDQTEAFAPIQKEALQTGGMILGLLLAGSVLTFQAYRQQHATLMRRTLQAEQEQKNTSARQNALLHAVINSPSKIVIFSVDRNYCYTAFNEVHRREMHKIWNVDIKLGDNLLTCMADLRLRALAQQSIDRVLAGEAFTEVQDQTGTEICYEFSWNPIRQAEQGIVGVTAFIRDVSARKQAEKLATAQMEELLRWQQAMEGREGRVLEMKQEVNELLRQAGQPIRYPSAAEGSEP